MQILDERGRQNIRTSALHCLVLSQSTRVTDRQTDGQTGGQNYDSNIYRASMRYVRRAVKMQITRLQIHAVNISHA